MTYINFVELHSWMLHAKFKNHRPFGSEKEGFCYSHGGHLIIIIIIIIIMYLFKEDDIFST